MKLSIIVPVYNVENYIEKCVDSILKQQFTDFELLLIDDRSPDRSGEICDRLATADNRIKVIHRQENGGLSVARNTGLDIASGEYVAFIDSDDFISSDTLSNIEIFSTKPDVDIVEFPVNIDYGSKSQRTYIPANTADSKSQAFDQWVQTKGYYYCYACNKIYRKRLWDDLRFPEGKYYEDIYTIPLIVKKASHIASSNKGMYYYCKRESSITGSFNEKIGFDFISAELQLFSMLNESRFFTKTDADLFYLTICNWQANYLRFGGEYMMPDYDINLKGIIFSNQPLAIKLKALAKKISGNGYCSILAKFLNITCK